MSQGARPTFLLVHGAWHGAWCWKVLQFELGAHGWSSDSVDLPSATNGHPDDDSLPGMYDDAQVIRDAVRSIAGPVVVVAHSYGRIPTTEAIGHEPDVVAVVYLAALMLDADESLFGASGVPLSDSPVGVVPVPEDPMTSFYGGVEPGSAAAAIAQLRPQSVRSWTEPVTTAGWRNLPSLYVICDLDMVLPPAVQGTLSLRANAIKHLASGHSPFLSTPVELTNLLTDFAGSLA
jgi:hypothetical protein